MLKALDKSPEICVDADLIYFIFSTESDLCCLLILADISSIKTLLLKIPVNIIPTPMPFHMLPGILLNVSGILIFLIPMNFCVRNTRFWVQSPGSFLYAPFLSAVY